MKMASEQETIQLFSNVNTDSAHQNTVAHFFTKLPYPRELQGRWDVALAEVTVPGLDRVDGQRIAQFPELQPYIHGPHLTIRLFTNIIEPSLFGSEEKRILRSFPIVMKPEHNGYTSIEFETLHFKPLSHRVLREIELRFELPNGDIVPFEAKRSSAVLILQKSANQS